MNIIRIDNSNAYRIVPLIADFMVEDNVFDY